MKPVNEILTILKNNATAELPSLLSAYGIANFNVYEIGQSRDESDTGFFVYEDKKSWSHDRNQLDLVLQLQLPGLTVLESAKYKEAIFEWISGYDVSGFGMIQIDMIETETWPNVNVNTTIIFFDVSISEELDSCDQRR